MGVAPASLSAPISQPRSHFLPGSTTCARPISIGGQQASDRIFSVMVGHTQARWVGLDCTGLSRVLWVITPDWRRSGESRHAEPPSYSTRHYS